MAVVIVATSIIWKLAADQGLSLYLLPGAVFSGQLWQLLTWLPAAAPDVGSVIFSALIVWMTGGSLEGLWGARRYLRFLLVTVFLAGLLTLALGLVSERVASTFFFGGNLLSSVTWVGFGCAMWRSTLLLFGFPVTGRTFALLGLGFTLLNVVFTSPVVLAAHLFALALTFGYARFGLPASLFGRLSSWRLRRDLEKRSSHLRALDGGRRNVGSGSDKFLH